MRRVEDLTFSANYRLLDDEASPYSGFTVVAPFGSDGMAVGVERGPRKFSVILPPGDGDYDAGVFVASSPNPDWFVAGVLGSLYRVKVDKEGVEVVDLNGYAASASLSFPERAVLIVADFVHLVAIGPNGLLWSSDQISDDVIAIVGQDGPCVLLNTYSAAEERWTTRLYEVGDDGLALRPS